ncbi:MAG: hypothetical protein ACI915_002020 [Gammaproteobacteria bacterium]|jgi:hypothetical protein
MDARTYLRRWTIVIVAMLASFALFSIAVDPYGIWDAPRVGGFNAKKPQAATRKQIVKPYMVKRVMPRTVIVGNSRPDMGLDPESTCWRADRLPVYNSSIPGSSVLTQLLLAAHAIETSGTTQVFVGVDFRDYLVLKSMHSASPKLPQIFPGSERLALVNFGENNHQLWGRAARDYGSSTLSLDALKDAFATILVSARLTRITSPEADSIMREPCTTLSVTRGRGCCSSRN